MATRKIVDCKDLYTGNKVFPRTHAAAVLLSDGRSVDMAIEQFETAQEVYVIDLNGDPSEVYSGLKTAWDAGIRSYAFDFVLAAPCVVTYIGNEFDAVSITGIDRDRSLLQVLQYKITSTEITEVGNREFPLGGITEESDPIFSASPVAGITEEQIIWWNNKVNSNDEYYQKVCMVDMTGISYPKSEAYTRIRTAIENGVTLFYCRVQTNSWAAEDLSYYPSVVRDISDDGSEYEVITQLNIAGNTGIWIGYITAETLQSFDYAIGVSNNSMIYLLTDGEGTKVLTDNGDYAELKSINGASIIGSGDIEIASVSESTVSEWGFTKNEGTITGITMNGVSKGSSGVVDLGTVITSHQDISGKQDKLVSGMNIKSINGTSLLGSGNIEVGGDSSGKVEEVLITPTISGTTATFTIPAGVMAWCDTSEITSSITSVVLNLDCSSFPSEEIYQFHIFVDDISSASLSIGWQGATDSTIWWPNGSAPTLEGYYTSLELSLLAGVGYEDAESYFFAYGMWNRLSPTI